MAKLWFNAVQSETNRLLKHRSVPVRPSPKSTQGSIDCFPVFPITTPLSLAEYTPKIRRRYITFNLSPLAFHVFASGLAKLSPLFCRPCWLSCSRGSLFDNFPASCLFIIPNSIRVSLSVPSTGYASRIIRILFYNQTPAMFVFHSSVLDILQSMVELCQYGTWFVTERVSDIFVWVNDFGQR